MKTGPDISRIAALIGDPARANILTALMAGKALTASELGAEAGVGLPTASAHLAKLGEGGLIAVEKQGRHRYFRLAGPEVARLIEALMGFAAGQGLSRVRTGPQEASLREARLCYNHLAGRRGVQIYGFLQERGLIAGQEVVELTAAGVGFMAEFGIDLAALGRSRVPLCRSCLDWSERRHHLAGSLGRALLAEMETRGWLRRDKASRAVLFSPQGAQAFDRVFAPR